MCASSSTVAQDLRLKLLEFSTSVFGAVRDNVELTADRPRDAPMAPLDRALLERVEAAEKEANELAVRVAHAREATKARVREAIERDVVARLRRLEGEVALPADADSGRKPLVEKKLLASAATDLAEARRDVDEARRELETRIIAATASLDVVRGVWCAPVRRDCVSVGRVGLRPTRFPSLPRRVSPSPDAAGEAAAHGHVRSGEGLGREDECNGHHSHCSEASPAMTALTESQRVSRVYSSPYRQVGRVHSRRGHVGWSEWILVCASIGASRTRRQDHVRARNSLSNTGYRSHVHTQAAHCLLLFLSISGRRTSSC